jgi:ribosomal protein L37AE/L43A
MSTSLLERPPTEDLFGCEDGQLLLRDPHSSRTDGCGGLTLDELITGVWECLASDRTVRCPVCGGTMVSRSAARAADCDECGTNLA